MMKIGSPTPGFYDTTKKKFKAWLVLENIFKIFVTPPPPVDTNHVILKRRRIIHLKNGRCIIVFVSEQFLKIVWRGPWYNKERNRSICCFFLFILFVFWSLLEDFYLQTNVWRNGTCSSFTHSAHVF